MSGLLGGAAGLAVLLGAGALLASAIYFIGVWRDAVRPARRTMGWALARGAPGHPEELGLATQERTVRCGGQPVPAWFVQGRGGSGAPAVVFLHGHGRSRWDSLRRIGPWIDRAWLLVLPDLRGHGEAPGRSTLGRREPADIAALLAEIDALRPGTPVILVGHSLGAVVAIHAAAAREAAGAPLAGVHAYGPYERVRTPFEARLRARGLPTRPFSDLAIALVQRLDGPEIPTSAAAARLAATPLEVTADAGDAVSPPQEARAIAQAAPRGRFHCTTGIAHGELGV